MQGDIAAFTTEESYRQELEIIANRIGIPIADFPSSEEVLLCLDSSGLYLSCGELKMQGDFTRMISRLKQSNLQSETLVRAAKFKHSDHMPTAIDATAGMGEDSLLLAAAGFSVKLFEYNPIIAALLQDTIRRAREIPELSLIVSRMQAFHADSMSALRELSEPPDLVLLDPMFPAKKKSGLVKKKFQLLQRLEQPHVDENGLLGAAIAANPHKIVIKRPAKGENFAGVKPSYSINGKVIRYDCILLS